MDGMVVLSGFETLSEKVNELASFIGWLSSNLNWKQRISDGMHSLQIFCGLFHSHCQGFDRLKAQPLASQSRSFMPSLNAEVAFNERYSTAVLAADKLGIQQVGKPHRSA